MPRVAGDSSSYTFGVIDWQGNITELKWGLPSVTSILDSVLAKPQLLHWMYSKGLDGVAELSRKGFKIPGDPKALKQLMGSEKLSPYGMRNAAAAKGRSLHDDLETWCNTGELEVSDRTAGLRAWILARHLTPSDIIQAEQVVVSLAHRYAGTLDIVYRDPQTGRIVLADLKTGNTVQWAHFVQGRAYKIAWEEMGTSIPFDGFRDFVDDIRIVHVNKKAGPEGWAELSDSTVLDETWLAVLSLYRMLPEKWHPTDAEDDEVREEAVS